MKILFFYPLWGSEHIPPERFLEKVRQQGFDGVEMVIPYDRDYGDNLLELLDITGLKLLGHQHLPPQHESPGGYIKRMEKLLYHLAGFNPILINSHTGRDFYSFEDNCRIIEKVKVISEETAVPIVHETHRGRFSFSTYTTGLYFKRYPDLKIAADFSHWCSVSESLLEDQESFLNEAFQRTEHIHARVGNSQAPQVNHPEAPENRKALERHLQWWQNIIDLRKKEGREYFTITTEFGPEPYMQTLPFTNQPVADQWQNNLFMKKFLNKKLIV